MILTILAIIMGILIGGIIIFGFTWGFLGLVFPDYKYFIKYKIRKKEPNEEDIEFIIENIEKGHNRWETMKEYLLKNGNMKKAKEISFLFLEVEKKYKGVEKNEL